MINTYVYIEPKNNVSHVLTGVGGNTVRFNFEHGNVITHKLPQLTLRSEYCQDLLENSELFKSGIVRKINSIAEPSDVIKDTQPYIKKEANAEEVRGIRTSDEVIAYINQRFEKDCRTLATAMKHAAKANLVFPDYNE